MQTGYNNGAIRAPWGPPYSALPRRAVPLRQRRPAPYGFSLEISIDKSFLQQQKRRSKIKRPLLVAGSDQSGSHSAFISWPLRPLGTQCMDGVMLCCLFRRLRSAAYPIFARLASAVLVILYVDLSLMMFFACSESALHLFYRRGTTQSDVQSSVRGKPK